MAGTASATGTVPQTPQKSPVEESDSALSLAYAPSDTEAIINHDWCKDKDRLQARANKLKAQLGEVGCVRKATRQKPKEKARKIKNEILEVERERKAADRRQSESLKAMELKCPEQDRTGDYGTDAVGYDVEESIDFRYAKREDTSRCVTLNIKNQAVVNRLFNMPTSVLRRKVSKAVMQKTKPLGGERFPGITRFLGAELLDDGNITLWAKYIDDYDFGDYRKDAFDGLSDRPPWDQAIFGSFAGHLTERDETYSVKVKDITAEMLELRDRKQKAAVITKFVKQNFTAIPSLHIDIIRDIGFSRNTTHDNTQALVLDLSNAVTANEVIHQGLRWEGRTYLCELFDVRFLNQCGCCQEYGHRLIECVRLPRCAKCAEQHYTKFCTSTYIKCVLCEEQHIAGSSQCRGKKARRVDELNVYSWFVPTLREES